MSSFRKINRSNIDKYDCNIDYHWDMLIKEKIKICNSKLDDGFDILIRNKIYIYVYSEEFDMFYNDGGDYSLSELLNNANIPTI